MADDNLREGFEKFKSGIKKEVERFLVRVGQKVSDDAENQIRASGAIASSKLLKGIGYEILNIGGRMSVVIGVNKNVKDEKGNEYAIFVHEGSKAHFPPIEPLTKWVIRKGLVKRNKRPTTFRTAEGTSVEKVAKGIAFVIARSIAKKGTKARPFLRLAFNQNLSFIRKEFNSIKV